MAPLPTPAPCPNLGFLSVLQETGGYVGGYLVTNGWGRPLEFRLTSAVQPNKVQQILYGDTLQSFLCGELIGKTLIEKTSTQAQLVVTDNPTVLDLRLRLDLPVALWSQTAPATALVVQPNLYCHLHYPEDSAAIRALLDRLSNFDLGEPFLRIREAIGEARKMGVSARAA